jgi:hypothetical protein
MLSEIKKAVSLYFEPLKKLLQFRVKRWHTAMRGWDEKDIRVIICLEDLIWYWMVLEWLFWDNGTYICHWLGYVPLPKFICNWERHWDKDDPEYFAKFGDWFGDDFGCLWHVWVCDPTCQWVWKHKDFKKAWPQWELTLEEARKTFAHDPAIYEWVEKELEQHKKWVAEKAE